MTERPPAAQLAAVMRRINDPGVTICSIAFELAINQQEDLDRVQMQCLQLLMTMREHNARRISIR